MSQREWTRRDLLKWGLGTVAATAALEGLGHMTLVPGWNRLLSGSHLPHAHWAVKDSFQLTQLLAKPGTAGQLAALFQLQEAAAQSAINDEWSLITIKVFDQVYMPLVFALGEIDSSIQTGNGVGDVKTATLKDLHFAVMKTRAPTAMEPIETLARRHLVDKGINRLSADPRFARLRMNGWFADILKSGRYDVPGSPMGEILADYSSYLKPFPGADEVALQVGVGVQPTNTSIPVHRLWHSKMRDGLPDLCHQAASKGLVNSPLGITCFMMGENYDHNGSISHNVVLTGRTKEDGSYQVRGRSLNEIVGNIAQSLNAGFTDVRSHSDNKNLTYIFDQLVTAHPERRKAMLDNRKIVTDQIEAMKNLSNIEKNPVKLSSVTLAPDKKDIDSRLANVQAEYMVDGNKYVEVAAKHEFLSHCAFVAKALDIQGQPYRNFSLFLNLNDLDGKNIDDPSNPDPSFKAHSLNYVEGMRQLALGLNMLGNAIKGKKALVVVISDGGRTVGMGDGAGPSFSMLLGPGNLLGDQLYAPMTYINQPTTSANVDSVFGNIGNLTTSMNWDGDSFGAMGGGWGLVENTGAQAKDSSGKATVQTNTGDWQAGAYHFLCEQKGRLDLMNQSLGRYVRFRRKV